MEFSGDHSWKGGEYVSYTRGEEIIWCPKSGSEESLVLFSKVRWGHMTSMRSEQNWCVPSEWRPMFQHMIHRFLHHFHLADGGSMSQDFSCNGLGAQSINPSTMSTALHTHIIWTQTNFCCTNAPKCWDFLSITEPMPSQKMIATHWFPDQYSALPVLDPPKAQKKPFPLVFQFTAEIQAAVLRWYCRNSQKRTAQSLWSQSVWLTWGCTTLWLTLGFASLHNLCKTRVMVFTCPSYWTYVRYYPKTQHFQWPLITCINLMYEELGQSTRMASLLPMLGGSGERLNN